MPPRARNIPGTCNVGTHTWNAHRHRHVNSKCKVMDDVQRIDAEIFPDWPNKLGTSWPRRPCRANGLHHGQMRNDVVFAVRLYTAGLTARESPIFWNNKIVRENGFSGTVTLPLHRRGTSPRFSVQPVVVPLLSVCFSFNGRVTTC